MGPALKIFDFVEDFGRKFHGPVPSDIRYSLYDIDYIDIDYILAYIIYHRPDSILIFFNRHGMFYCHLPDSQAIP